MFWATTYTFELPFFESFLLPRLGEAPLNATVLVDAHRHADALQNLGVDTPWRGARANRDYLVRGVAPTNGAFHPKTYFFGNDRTGLLYVGSGNLAMSGLETGKEVFARFDAAKDEDLGAIRGWRAWLDEVVDAVDDPAVRERWRDAQLRAPWMVGLVEPAAFAHNWHMPLLDVFLNGIEGRVDELHLTAPFYDERAATVLEIVRRTSPRRIEVLVGRDASVHGPALLNVLERSGADIAVHGLDPDTYVHGKLLGVVWGGRGRILSGSANLSTAALLRAVAGDLAANVECGSIAEVDPEAVRAAFSPPPPPAWLSVVPRDLSLLELLRFAPSDESRFSIHLRSAVWLSDGRIRVDIGNVGDRDLRLSNGDTIVELEDAVTVRPFGDDSVRFVWTVDDTGHQVSNKVAIDEPGALRAALAERTAGGERPDGIEAADLETPVGQMLARLHNTCIFDFDETPTARRIARAADAESDDPDFWDKLAREDLRQDPRVARYLQLGTDTPLLDGIFLDIARMLEAVPRLSTLRVVGDETPVGGHGSGVRWTPDRKLQVRLFNLLERWCGAISDPRLQWISPLTPVANFAALLGALRECWVQGYLAEHRVVALVGVLLTAFVRGERRPGFLSRLTDTERTEAMAALATSASPTVLAALVFAAVRPSQKDLLSYLFAWQPAIVEGLAEGSIRPNEEAAALVRGLTGQTISGKAMAERIEWASTYLDDARWSDLISRELGLQVTLTVKGFAERFGASLSVEEDIQLLVDPRIVEVVRRALEYRKTDGCVVDAGDDRLSVRRGDVFAAKIGGAFVDSDEVVTSSRLDHMAAAGASFSEVMTLEQATA